MDYIYAVLHSPTYREKYKEFLKIDFPRVPYPKDKETFWQLVKLGGELRQIHLLESSALKVPYNTSVQISWSPSSNATHCNCTYYEDANNPNVDCGSGVGREVTGDTLTLAQSKTFSVKCDDN